MSPEEPLVRMDWIASHLAEIGARLVEPMVMGGLPPELSAVGEHPSRTAPAAASPGRNARRLSILSPLHPCAIRYALSGR
jgi:hypothetical protein